MNQSNSLSVQLKRREAIAGWIYLPFYLFLLSAILSVICVAMGYDVLDMTFQADLNLIFGLVNFVIVCIIFHRFLILNLSNVVRRFWGYIQAVILGFVLYWVGTTAISLLVTWLNPDMINHNNETVEMLAGSNYRAMLLYTVALAPIIEESLFRGLIFSSLHRTSRVAAYTVSALAFAALHVAGFIGTAPWLDLLLSLLQYLPAGIAMGWAYERADSIWAPITIHVIVNAIAMLTLQLL